MARTAAKVADTTAKKVKQVAKSPAAQDVESGVIRLAEQIGWLVGTVQNRADGLMDNEQLRQQMTLIRDGASTLLDQVSRAGSVAGQSVSRMASAAKAAMPGVSAKAAKAAKQAAADAKRQQSRKPVAAPGKKHRKPPPQVKVQRHASEPATAPMIQKPMPNRQRRGVR